MEPSELLQRFVEVLERSAIPYRVTGSMASIAYGEPRLTNDIDIVVQLTPGQVDAFCAAFPPPDFYCSREAARQAVEQRFQFNVLHPHSGLKVDVIIAGDSPFDQSRFARGQRLLTDAEHEAWFASPEDVILKKLVYFQEGGSEKHLRDIVGILKVQAGHIDQPYLAEWIARLGVAEEWQLVQSRMPRANRGEA